MNADELEKCLRSDDPPPVLDVRTAMEFNSGHIPGALHAPLLKLYGVAAACSGDRGDLMVLVCEHGPRAQLSQSLLKLRGYKNVVLLTGHMAHWRQAGRLLEPPA